MWFVGLQDECCGVLMGRTPHAMLLEVKTPTCSGASDLTYPGLIRFHSQVYSSVRSQALEFQSLPRPCDRANPSSTVVLGHGPASLGFGCGSPGPSPGLRSNFASLAAVFSCCDQSIAANASPQATRPLLGPLAPNFKAAVCLLKACLLS